MDLEREIRSWSPHLDVSYTGEKKEDIITGMMARGENHGPEMPPQLSSSDLLEGVLGRNKEEEEYNPEKVFLDFTEMADIWVDCEWAVCF